MFEIPAHGLVPQNWRSATVLSISLHAGLFVALLLYPVRAVWRMPTDHVTQIVYLPQYVRSMNATRSAPDLSPRREIKPAFAEPQNLYPNPARGQVILGGFDTLAGEIARGFGGNGKVDPGGWNVETGGGHGFLPDGPATADVFNGVGAKADRPALHQRQEPDEPAELLRGASPEYTSEAIRNRVTGEVWLEVELRSSGEVHVLRVLSQPLGYGLEDVAVRAANQYRCKPARKAGRQITVVGQIKVAFLSS